MNDKLILALFRDRPESALEEVMKTYMKLVTHIVRNSLIPPFTEEDVDECVSDVFMKFYKNASYIDPDKGSIKAYLCKMAKNRATDFRRVNPYDQIACSLDETLENDDEKNFCGEDIIENKERMDALASAITSLPETDREIIVRKYYYLEKSRDIAERLGLTANAVDIRAFKALKKLKTILGGDFLEN